MILILSAVLIALALPANSHYVPCREPDYMCRNGRCIPPSSIGDGFSDCNDDLSPNPREEQEDETEAAIRLNVHRNVPVCRKGGNKTCYDKGRRRLRCLSPSDICSTSSKREECKSQPNCGFYRRFDTCKPDEFKCYNSESCISLSQVCDQDAADRKKGQKPQHCPKSEDESMKTCGAMFSVLHDSFGFETPILIEAGATLDISCHSMKKKENFALHKKEKGDATWKRTGIAASAQHHYNVSVAEGLYGCAKDETPLLPTVKIRALLCNPVQSWQCKVGEVCTVENGQVQCNAKFDRSFCEMTAYSYEYPFSKYRRTCHQGSVVSACAMYAEGHTVTSVDVDGPKLTRDQQLPTTFCESFSRQVRRNNLPVEMYQVSVTNQSGLEGLQYENVDHSYINLQAEDMRFRTIDETGYKYGKPSNYDSIVPYHVRVKYPHTIRGSEASVVTYEDFIVVGDSSKIPVPYIYDPNPVSNGPKLCDQYSQVRCYHESAFDKVPGVKTFYSLRLSRDGEGEATNNRSIYLSVGTYNYTCTVEFRYRLMTTKVHEVLLARRTDTKQIQCMSSLELQHADVLKNMTKKIRQLKKDEEHIRQYGGHHGGDGLASRNHENYKSKVLAIGGIVLGVVAIAVIVVLLLMLMMLARRLWQLQADVQKMGTHSGRRVGESRDKEKGGAKPSILQQKKKQKKKKKKGAEQEEKDKVERKTTKKGKGKKLTTEEKQAREKERDRKQHEEDKMMRKQRERILVQTDLELELEDEVMADLAEQQQPTTTDTYYDYSNEPEEPWLPHHH